MLLVGGAGGAYGIRTFTDACSWPRSGENALLQRFPLAARGKLTEYAPQ
jgi:hypothetical protein